MKRTLITEKVIHRQVCAFLKYQYPHVVFTSDMSGMRVTIGLRVEMQSKRSDKFKIPDLIILHPSNGSHGLLIEIKKSRSDVYTKDGKFKTSEHIKMQKKTLDTLNARGYLAVFGCGFEECRDIIKKYFNTKRISNATELQNIPDH